MCITYCLTFVFSIDRFKKKTLDAEKYFNSNYLVSVTLKNNVINRLLTFPSTELLLFSPSLA